MAIAEAPRGPITRPAAPPWTAVLHDWVTTVDHKKIGILYVIMAVVFLMVGGVEALLLRWQLLWPRYDFLGPDVFNQMFTLHGTTMVFFMGMPILIGMGNYLVPLMIGARDMAFPRLNALGLWATLFGLGVFAARPYLPRATGWVGLFYLGCGALLLAAAPGDLTRAGWAVGGVFAVGQVATAWVLHRNEERAADV